ncbi:MAG: hypothetical protein HYY68_05470 [Thaumarchaeota archaeon]|nr:hypothetical protein [Nitrososphaerota archaeon]MBI3023161.1 hypothetical protein [Nitrososphaerota archaeon]MBI3116800.1 hypothetical protein [Nitrososphaerota archaeon]
MASQNSLDIVGDVEYFGCGCEALVDLKSGEARTQYLCVRHRFNLNLPIYVLEAMR